MYVCLMRHGKAQPFELHQPDKLRELTEKDVTRLRPWQMGSLLVAVGPDGPVGQPVRADVPDGFLFREISAYRAVPYP